MPADDYKIGDEGRRVTTDQLEQLREANPGQVAWDTEAPADFTYLYHPDRILVRAADTTDFEAALGRNSVGSGERDDDPIPGQLARYTLTDRADGQSVVDILDLLDADPEFGPDRARLDHWMHVTTVAKCCPATEPEETGLIEPWPPESDRRDPRCGTSAWSSSTPAGTRLSRPQRPHTLARGGHRRRGDREPRRHPSLCRSRHLHRRRRPMSCSGDHASSSRASPSTVWSPGTANGVGGGGVLESEIVQQLIEAVENHDPRVINLSAGCRTRGDIGPLTFEVFWESHLKSRNCVLVAAAGNDSSPAPFWPAAFPWAVGVGSLDRDGRVSSFSNHCSSADVYAVGRNLVNAFPKGTYTCRESPNTGDVRVFSTGMARWSGTSFATPIVAGMIAAQVHCARRRRQGRARPRPAMVPSGCSDPEVRADQGRSYSRTAPPRPRSQHDPLA